ncbi:MAG: hypothetical protein ABIO02_02850 [Patescibacteria group bacterium]
MDFEHALHIFNSLYENINGYSLSSLGRAQVGSDDKAFTYGEISPEAFYSILSSLPIKPKGVFYDLGSGTGKAVLLAHMLFEFERSVGIEFLEPLHDGAVQVISKYHKQYKSLVPEKREIELIHGNFLIQDFSDADIIFMHSTCFPDYIWEQLEEKFKHLKEDAYLLTVTKTIHTTHFQYIKSKEFGMAWGRATVHFYKKC